MDEKDKEAGMPVADRNELRFLYLLAAVFTGLAFLLSYYGNTSIATGIVLMCVVIFLLSGAGFCIGTALYVMLIKLLHKK